MEWEFGSSDIFMVPSWWNPNLSKHSDHHKAKKGLGQRRNRFRKEHKTFRLEASKETCPLQQESVEKNHGPEGIQSSRIGDLWSLELDEADCIFLNRP